MIPWPRRPGATVPHASASTPIGLDEIDEVEPAGGTIKTVPERLAALGDPLGHDVDAHLHPCRHALAPDYARTAMVASTSTAMLAGNDATPTARRTCSPRSPKTCVNTSEAPSITAV